MPGERSSRSELSREKKEGLIGLFPAAFLSTPTGHAPRSVSVSVISRPGSAAAEARWRFRLRGSHMDLTDGLETGSPYLHLHYPDLAFSQGSKASTAVLPPLNESALLLSHFFLLGDWYCFLYPSGSRVAEATRALRSFSVHYRNLSFTPHCVYLSGCLAAFNFEELNYAFHLTMMSYLYKFKHSISQKWVHPSHLCKYFIISFHVTIQVMTLC